MLFIEVPVACSPPTVPFASVNVACSAGHVLALGQRQSPSILSKKLAVCQREKRLLACASVALTEQDLVLISRAALKSGLERFAVRYC